jgi:ABC-type glycerol-3-phosphate transport system substrate-binding protein
MKKLMFVGLVMVTALVMGGCSAKRGALGSAANESGRTGAKGTIPISTAKPQLSMFIYGGLSERTTSYDYKDNVFTKRVVDETGIQLSISSATAADSTERLNIMLNAGDYPDIIANTALDIEYYAPAWMRRILFRKNGA